MRKSLTNSPRLSVLGQFQMVECAFESEALHYVAGAGARAVAGPWGCWDLQPHVSSSWTCPGNVKFVTEKGREEGEEEHQVGFGAFIQEHPNVPSCKQNHVCMNE